MKRTLIQHVKGVKAIAPQSASADVVGDVIDRNYAREAVITLVTGAASGSPTATKVKAVIKHGDKADGSDQAEIPIPGTFESAEIGADSVAQVHVNLEGLKRYITVTAEVDFQGGTSPEVLVAATATLGNYEVNPDHIGDDGTLVYGPFAGDGKGYTN